MSALRAQTTAPPQPLAEGSESLKSANTVPLDSQTRISNESSAPQVAGRPPAAPKAEKARPRIRATKAALSMVRLCYPNSSQAVNLTFF
jgi:iron-sulfur cluster assembly 1